MKRELKPYSRLTRIQVSQLIKFLGENADKDQRLLHSHGELARRATESLGFNVNRSHIWSFAADLGLKSKNQRLITPATPKEKEDILKDITKRLDALEQRIVELTN